jgi:hypothetical protein
MSAATSKIIVILAFLCLMIAAIFGLLGSYKVDALRTDVASANAARDAAEHRRVTQETELKARETGVAGEEAKQSRKGRSRTRAIGERENGIADQVTGEAERDRFPAKADRRSRDNRQTFAKTGRYIDTRKATYLYFAVARN